ncbi:hypothetical protein BELL_0101g00190 [Botrytis elliptica]|uniref:Uncharacterized protein n=1 Tax=Botrytis elliptica TaxID=278938 RepID=A0A4Z1JWK7_9HELO|nr:hypothetical protein EAE99_008305 [Botrytis elliptica]TGO77574.1 hypothetical protein BELL_0101g00190 [Botrytis elliptica]
MNPEIPAPRDSQDVQDGGAVQQAVELVGKMLEQIQIELEKMLSQRGEVPSEADAPENEKDESQKRYKTLESNYQKISEELKVFGRQIASAPDKSGQVQAELKLAQAKNDIEKLKAEVQNLQAQCIDYQAQAQAHQNPQNVQELETQLEELKFENKELQRKRVERLDKDPNVWRRFVNRDKSMEEAGPMQLFKERYIVMLSRLDTFVFLYLDWKQEPKMELIGQRKRRDKTLRWAFEKKPDHERLNRLKRAVFQFLSDEILLQPAFGLDDEDEGVKMEAGLTAFERKLRESSKGDDQIVSNVKLVLANDFADQLFESIDCHNWRKLTYRCAKVIRERDSESKIVALASAWEDFLRPVPKKDVKIAQELMLKICREAFTLSQLLRAEPVDYYKIYFPQPGDSIPPEKNDKFDPDPMKVWGEEAGFPANEVGTVAYNYYGGLFFRDMHQQEVWNPLVPAQVIAKVTVPRR